MLELLCLPVLNSLTHKNKSKHMDIKDIANNNIIFYEILQIGFFCFLFLHFFNSSLFIFNKFQFYAII